MDAPTTISHLTHAGAIRIAVARQILGLGTRRRVGNGGRNSGLACRIRRLHGDTADSGWLIDATSHVDIPRVSPCLAPRVLDDEIVI